MTTVKVPDELEKEIESMKVHPKQPAYEIIEKAISLLKALRQTKPQLEEWLLLDKTLKVSEKRMVKELLEKL